MEVIARRCSRNRSNIHNNKLIFIKKQDKKSAIINYLIVIYYYTYLVTRLLHTTYAHNFTCVKLVQEQIYGKPKINVKSCTNVKAFRFVV